MLGRGSANSDEDRTGGGSGTPPKLPRFALLLAANLFLLAFLLPQLSFFEILELKTQDLRLRTRGERKVSPDIVVIEFEKNSLTDYNRQWPIARNQYALMINALNEWGAKAIGFDLLFGGPDKYDAFNDTLLAAVTGMVPQTIHAMYYPLTLPGVASPPPADFEDPHAELIERLYPPLTGNPMLMTTVPEAVSIDLPPVLLDEIDVLAHIGLATDEDGVVRKIPILVDHEGRKVPGLSLVMACYYLGLDWRQTELENEGYSDWQYMVVGGGENALRIPVDKFGRIIINFPGPETTFKNRYAFIDVINSVSAWMEGNDPPGNLPRPEEFEGKIVLICNTAASSASADFGPTPFSSAFPLAFAHASATNSMLLQDFLRGTPRWIEILALGIIALALAFFLPPLTPSKLAMVSAGAIGGVLLASWGLAIFVGILTPIITPLFLISTLSVGILTQAFVVKDRERLAVTRELAVAQKIQQDLLPKKALEANQVRVWGKNLPCYAVGGDYFDYFEVADGLIAIAIGDVSGKGVPAAILMSNIQAILRGECTRSTDVTQILENANNLLMHSIEDSNKFITFFFATLDPKTNRLKYSNAGHNPPLLVRADGTIEKLEEGGLLLGIFPDATFEEGNVELREGDSLVMFTDGVTEAEDRNKNQLGDDFIEELVVEIREGSAQEIGERICLEVNRFSQGIHATDDTTVVIVKIEPPGDNDSESENSPTEETA